MNPLSDLVRGEDLRGQFSYHIVRSAGPPMIHVTRNRRPEIVVFGPDQHLQPPVVIDAGKQIMIDARAGNEVTISKFAINEPDQRRVVSTSVDEVIRAIVELGGTYPDVVQALQQAKQSQALTSRFEVDALPIGGREYVRNNAAAKAGEAAEDKEVGSQIVVDTPLPELFSHGNDKPDAPKKKAKTASAKADDEDDDDDEKETPRKGFFAKMTGKAE
jgi:hypothetical protein